jgi:hypothetical protein
MLLPDLAAQDLMNLCSLLYFGKEESKVNFVIKQLVLDLDPHGSALFFGCLGSGSVLGMRIRILIHEHMEID